MGYTGTTNYGFQKPAKENAFTVNDLNNALDKIDETIKARDDAQNSKNTEQDTTIANNNVTAIISTIVNPNTLKVEITKGDGSKISGQTFLPESGGIVEVSDFPGHMITDTPWGYNSSSGQYYSFVVTDSIEISETVHLRTVDFDSGIMDTEVVYDSTTNMMKKFISPHKVMLSDANEITFISKGVELNLDNSNYKNTYDSILNYFKEYFVDRYTNMSKIYIGHYSNCYLEFNLVKSGNRIIDVTEVIVKSSSTTINTIYPYRMRNLYYCDEYTSDGKVGWISTSDFSGDIMNLPNIDEGILISTPKVLFDGNLEDLIKFKYERNVVSSIENCGSIEVIRPFDMEYVWNDETYRVHIPAMFANRLDTSNSLYLGKIMRFADNSEDYQQCNGVSIWGGHIYVRTGRKDTSESVIKPVLYYSRQVSTGSPISIPMSKINGIEFNLNVNSKSCQGYRLYV